MQNTDRTSEYSPQRSTTDASISPDDYRPVIKWLAQCHQVDPQQKPPYLFINADAQIGLGQLYRRANKAGQFDDIKLRLRHRDLAALGQQMRFWECCIDELKVEFRDAAPDWGHFASIADDIEWALDESHRPPQPKITLTCQHCRQPIGPNEPGTAAVDLHFITAWHHACQQPKTPDHEPHS